MTATHCPTRPTPRLAGLLGTGLAVCSLAQMLPAHADTVPPSIRTCIGEPDAAQRLACYDREVARLIAPAGTFAPAAATAAPPVPAAAQPGAAAAPVVPAAVAAASPSASALPASPPRVSPPQHLKAKVTAIHQSGDTLVVTLDNGDTWVQAGVATSELTLHPGSVAKLDYELGSWYLSDNYGNNIQVKPRPAE